MLARLTDKRIAIWGYGQEGRAAVATLEQIFPGKTVTVIVRPRELDQLVPEFSHLPHARLVTDASLRDVFCGVDVVIKSPGISPYRADVTEAQNKGVEFTSAR